MLDFSKAEFQKHADPIYQLKLLLQFKTSVVKIYCNQKTIFFQWH